MVSQQSKAVQQQMEYAPVIVSLFVTSTTTKWLHLRSAESDTIQQTGFCP
jgi:hypothetical protein